MKHPRHIFLYLLLVVMFKPFLLGICILTNNIHPVGYYSSPSKSGRTHYWKFRVFDEEFKYLDWMGIKIPMKVEEDEDIKQYCMDWFKSKEVRIIGKIERVK